MTRKQTLTVDDLQHLPQPLAAWLADVSPRTLRDAPIPRDETGRYDARGIVQWAAGRLPEPDLTTEELERVLNIWDQMDYAVLERAWAVVKVVDELVAKYGETVLLVVFREYIDNCRRFAAEPEPYTPPTEAEVRERIREEIAQRILEAEGNVLQYAVICDSCGRLRRGRKWIKADPPDDMPVIHSECPACLDELHKRSAKR